MEDSIKKYNGFYRGIVVQNNDPARSGKVKIYIPCIMPHVIERAKLENSDENIEVDYRNLFDKGEDAFKDKDALKTLRNNLPWATQLSPLVGTGSSFNFFQKTDNITTADGLLGEEDDGRGKFPNSNEMPGHKLQLPPYFYSGCHDGLDINGEDMQTGRTDPDNDKVYPNLASNQSKGMFSIPSVNSYVWVFFENGEWEKPVYFGYDHRDIFWRDLYGSSVEGFKGDRYPNDYENSYNPKDDDVTLLRNEIIFNTRAGKLLFDETDYLQRIQLSYRTGSNFEFDNTGYKLYVEGKSTEAVNGDKLQTIEGDLTTCVKLDTNSSFKKDVFVKIGTRDTMLYRKVYKLFQERSRNVLDRFMKKRTNGPVNPASGNDLLTSSEYIEGKHTELPPSDKDHINFNIYNQGSPGSRKTQIHMPGTPAYTPNDYKGSDSVKPTPETSNTFKNIKDAIYKRATQTPAFSDGTYEGRGAKLSPKYYAPDAKYFKVGLDDEVSIDATYHNILNQNRHWHQRTSSSSINGSPQRFENSNKIAKWDVRGSQNKSQSTAGGEYEENLNIDDVAAEEKRLSPLLDEIIREDSHGGSLDCFVTRNATFIIGAAVNDLPALRVDPRGGLIFAGVRTTDTGSDNVYKSIPLCEETNNEDQFPVGNTTINSNNTLKINSGAGGVKINSTGSIETLSISTQLKSTHSIDLTSGGNLLLRAAKSISITADIISIRHSNDGQVAIGGSLGVENNITVGGSAIVNGEMYVQHITAPAEMQVTESIHNLQARTKSDEQVAYIPEGSILAKLSVEDCRRIVSIGHSSDPNQTGSGSGSVDVRSWAPEDEAAELGIPPEYEYDSELDDFILVPGTGYKDVTDDEKYGDRTKPELVNGDGYPESEWKFQGNNWQQSPGPSRNSLALKGTDRLTSIEVEGHSHQFKNLPLSLRTYNDDVYQEAADIEKYPDIKSIRKGQLHAKTIVKAYGESLRHKSIVEYLQKSNNYKQNNVENIKKEQFSGKKPPSVMDEVAQNISL